MEPTMQAISTLSTRKSIFPAHLCKSIIGVLFLIVLFLLPSQAKATIQLEPYGPPEVIPNGTNGYYGYSVDIDGNYAIVGAYHHAEFQNNVSIPDAGRVWILKKTNGSWTAAQNVELIRNEASVEYDEFGTSVAISGDYAVVGAPNRDSTSARNTGAVYVFHRNGNTWEQMLPVIKAYTTTHDAQFGHSVDIHGNYLIVGTPHKDSAHVYEFNGTTWQFKSPLTVSNPGTFGSSVAITDGYAIVGDPHDDTYGTYAGAAYIFKRNDENGTWGYQFQVLYPSGPHSPQQLDQFGCSVSIDGKYAIVGTNPPDQTGDGIPYLFGGAAYIFKRDNYGIWEQHGAYLHAEDNDPGGNNFGDSVSISGRYAIVGASGDNDRGTNAGAAFIYEVTEDDWYYKEKFVPPYGSASIFMGNSVATDKGNFLIGADNYGGSNIGAISSFSFDFDDDFDIDGFDLYTLRMHYKIT